MPPGEGVGCANARPVVIAARVSGRAARVWPAPELEDSERSRRRPPRPAPARRRPPVLPPSDWSWRRVRRLILLATLLSLACIAYSYVRAVTRPSSTSLGVRSVEWLRADVSTSLVNEVERIYYSLNAPSKGGAALRTLPKVGAASAPPPAAVRVYRPPRIPPVIRPALPGEGVWHATGPAVGGAPPVLVSTFRPDPSYPRMVAGVAWIDATRTRLALYPGRYEPPGAGPRGPMEVPPNLRGRLLATFNSGFRLEDGKGGFAAGGTVWSPLLPGMGTLVGYADGRVDVGSWSGGPRPAPGIVFARQNLPLIVMGGRLNPNLSDGPEWGATLGNAVRVWRSGLGVDRRGNLIYAAADQQTVGSLAQILRHAGAVRAMELDINYEWVSFISYGQRAGRLPTKLLFGIDHGGTRYLVPDDRDFFAVLAAPAGSGATGRGG